MRETTRHFQTFLQGGSGVILRLAGKDVTEQFHSLHAEHVLSKYHDRLCIGTVASKTGGKVFCFPFAADATRVGQSFH